MAKGKLTLAKAVKDLQRVQGDIRAAVDTLADFQKRESELKRWLSSQLGVDAPARATKGAPTGRRKGKQSKRRDIVEYIAAHPRCKAADVAKALGIKPNNANQAVFNLKKAGEILSLKEDGGKPKEGEKGGFLEVVKG